MNDTSRDLDYIAEEIGYKSTARYQSRAEFLFAGIPLSGKRVIDIGCGRGDFALYAALQGAEHVLGIEPDKSGSTTGTLSRFNNVIEHLNLSEKVCAEPKVLQDVQVQAGSPYDVAVLFNVINHLDEAEAQRLKWDSASVETYIRVLSHLRSLIVTGGNVIVADCARSNFWNALGMKAPLAKSIEWNKHQNPNVWIPIFRRAGFELHDLRWSYLYPFKIVSSNWLVQYFTSSHFVLRFRAV